MITTHKRNFIIIFKDKTQLNITEAQYNLYREEIKIKKYSDFITITDIDTKEIIFEGRCNEIKEFKQRKTDTSLASKVYVCDY